MIRSNLVYGERRITNEKLILIITLILLPVLYVSFFGVDTFIKPSRQELQQATSQLQELIPEYRDAEEIRLTVGGHKQLEGYDGAYNYYKDRLENELLTKSEYEDYKINIELLRLNEIYPVFILLTLLIITCLYCLTFITYFHIKSKKEEQVVDK